MADPILDALLTKLNVTDLARKDQKLYDFLKDLIKVDRINATAISAIASSVTPGGSSVVNSYQTIQQLLLEDSGGDGGDGLAIPGTPGPAGAAGIPGVTTILSIPIQGLDGVDGEENFIPGPQGVKGDTGITQVVSIPLQGLDGDQGDDGFPIPGNQGATGAAGGLVFLSRQTASSSASLDFNGLISSTYDRYLILCEGLLPATNGVAIGIRFDVGAGFDSGNNYRLATSIGTETGFSTQVASTSASRINIFPTISNGSTGGLNFTGQLSNVNSSSLHKRIDIQGDVLNSGDGNFYYIGGFGRYPITTSVIGFQVIASSGNLASGDVYLFGYIKS